MKLSQNFLRDRSLFMWGEKSWRGPGLFVLEKRGGPIENFMMVGAGQKTFFYSSCPFDE